MARTVSVALKLAITEFTKPAATAIGTVKSLGAEVDTLAKTNKQRFNDVAKVAAGAGVALLGFGAAAVKAALDFDKQMSEVQAVSNATGGGLENLRNAAILAGKQTAFSATEAAEAEAELAKAGVSTANILGGALKGSLSLAAAGQMDLADAATISAQTMNIFGLKGSAVSHIADVLASSANASAADMQGLGDSIKQGGLVAAQTGLSFEDTVGVLSAFADHALVGSDAGTSLKTMLQALQAPSGKTAALMQSLGINAYDAGGKFIGVAALAGQLQKQLGGLTQAQRANALAQIFGSDATRSASILYTEGAAGIQNYIDKVNQQGAAAKTAATKMDNLAGDTEQLKGSLETLAIESGGGVTSGLRTLAQGATGAVNAVLDMPPAVTSTVTVLTALSGGTLLAATGFVKGKATIDDFLSTLVKMGPTGEKAAGVLEKIGGVAGKVALAGAVVGGLVYGFAELSDWIDKKSAPTARNIDALTVSLKDLATYGRDLNGELTTTFGKGFGGLTADVQQIEEAKVKLLELTKAQDAASKTVTGSEAGRGAIYGQLQIADVGASTRQQQSDLGALDTALSQMATNGGAVQAKLAFQQLAAAQGWTDLETKNALALLPKYSASMAGVAAANTGAAQGFADTAGQVQTLTTSLGDAIAKGETFDTLWSELNGALFNSDKAGLAARTAIDNVTKTVKANHDAWKGNSEAALANRVAIGEAAEAAAKAADAKFQETGSVAAANDVYNTYIAQLRKSMVAAGLSTAAVNTLLGEYAKMPPLSSTSFATPGLVTANGLAEGYRAVMNDIPDSVYTVIKTPGLDTAVKGVRTLYTEIDQLHGKTVGVSVHYSSGLTASTNRWGGAYEHAAAGVLNEASYYSARSPGRYMIAEPKTLGEAFVPKVGNYGRSMSILNRAAGWYGASVVPGGYGGGRGGAIQILVSATAGAAAAHMEFLRFAIANEGGDPVAALTPR